MASVADFQLRFPEFCDEDDERVQLFLDDAALLMSDNESGKWLTFYDVAQLYHAAHLLAVGMSTESGDIGSIAPVRKQEVDDVIIEHAVSDIGPTADDLYSTSYGKRYISYKRICFTGIYGV